VALNRRKIAEQNNALLRRQQEFRLAADCVARALGELPGVQRVVLFGSVAMPLDADVPRREGLAVWHECKDVDLAVWAIGLEDLKVLNKACNQALAAFQEESQLAIGRQQIDMILLEPESDRYLGHLCPRDQCPKGEPLCDAPGCGKLPYLQRRKGFELAPKALASDRSVLLFQRRGRS
jgi:hypothetical protein